MTRADIEAINEVLEYLDGMGRDGDPRLVKAWEEWIRLGQPRVEVPDREALDYVVNVLENEFKGLHRAVVENPDCADEYRERAEQVDAACDWLIDLVGGGVT